MRPWDDEPHRPAALERDRFTIQSVGEKGRRISGRRLHRLCVAERRLEDLLGIVVVKTPVVDAAHVAHRAAEPQHLAQGHALPQTLAERRGDVQALDGLEKSNLVRLAQRDEGGQIERGATFERERLREARRLLHRLAREWIGDNLQPPRLGCEPRLDERLALQGVRLRRAARHVVVIIGRREQRMGIRCGHALRGLSDCRRGPTDHCARQRGRGEHGGGADKIAAREGFWFGVW